MKLTMIFLLAGFLTVSAEGISQNINFTGKDIPLKSVFQTVKEQTGYVFIYTGSVLTQSRPVTISAVNMPLEEFLNKVFKAQPLEYFIKGKSVFISYKEKVSPVITSPLAEVQAPTDIPIRGRVFGYDGKPLAGASVGVKNSKNFTTTNADGTFSLSVNEGDVIVVSFVGFLGVQIKVTSGTSAVIVSAEKQPLRDEIDEETDNVSQPRFTGNPTQGLVIFLPQSVVSMKDLVMTGIYQRKKESFSGSSATYTAKELKAVSNQNPLQALKTLDPAFAILENNLFGSDPNQNLEIEVRGKSSIAGLSEQFGADPNRPLFILDGFETSLTVISDLSMDRVESITLLKDAAATAIYGSKAANGVVVVETKRPIPGRLRLSYNLNTTLSFADLSDYNLMNAAEKLEFEKRSLYYGGVDANGNITSDGGDTRYNNRLKEVRRGVDTYWPNEPLRLGINQRHTLYAEGGDASFRFGGSLSYGDNQGVMRGSAREIVNGNLRLIYRKNRLSFNNSLSVDFVEANREPVPFSSFSRANPFFRKFNETGGVDKILEFYRYADFFSGITETITNYNPLYDMDNNNINKSVSQGFTNNFELDWRMIDELRVLFRVGLNRTANRSELFRSPYNSEFADLDPFLQGRYSESNGHQTNYDGNISLTYGKLFKQKHMLNAVGGLQLEQRSALSSGFEVRGFVDDELINPSFAYEFTTGKRPAFSESKRRSSSIFLNAGYSYDRRFLVDFTVRSDGASFYGAKSQFTNIWSAGLGWNIHNEKFFDKSSFSWLNMLRLRTSIGNPGNQNINESISMKIYQFNNDDRNPFGPSLIVSNFGNDELKWQQTLDWNAGIDLQMVNNRLRITADYFIKKTDPLLVMLTVPSSSGTSVYAQNLGGLETKGFTAVASYTVIQKNNFNWMLNMNMRHLESKYQNIGNSLQHFNDVNKGVNLVRYYDGASPSDLWAVRSLGIDPATGMEVYLNSSDHQTFVHNYSDEVVVGNAEPTVDGIIGTSARYKGFSVAINMRYRLGGQEFMQTLFEKVENISMANVALNQDKRALYDRWSQPGDNAKFKAISTTTYTPMSSRFVADNNILTGESISVGYEATTGKWLRAIRATSVTFRAYMNDIFRISSITNERGLEYPFARSVSFSAGVRF